MGYASAATDLVNVIPLTFMGPVTQAQAQAILDAASAEFDTCGRARYLYPLQPPYDPALVRDVCLVGAYEIACLRGYNEEAGADKNFRLRAEQARKKWYEVKTQSSHYNIIEANPPGPDFPAPLVVSQPLQGWMPGQGGPRGVY